MDGEEISFSDLLHMEFTLAEEPKTFIDNPVQVKLLTDRKIQEEDDSGHRGHQRGIKR